MAVTSVTDHPDSGAGRRTSDERTYVRKQIVRTNSRDDGPAVAFAHASVVKYGGIYIYRNESDTGARCLDQACDPYDGGLVPGGRLFLITSNFTSKFSEKEKQQEEQNPLFIPPRLLPSGAQEFRKIAEKDKDGLNIVNGAKERFLDPPEIEDYYYRMVIVNNEAYVDTDKIEDYTGSVNNATWRGASARKWLMSDISHSEARWQAGVRYYEFTYSMLKNRDTWDLSIMNVGMKVLVNSSLQNARDKDGNEVTSVVKLSTAGAMILQSCAANYISVRARQEKTWSTLGIEGAV